MSSTVTVIGERRTLTVVGEGVSLTVSSPSRVLGIEGSGGPRGFTGPSAYATAVEEGFSGDEAAWLLTLVGPTGATGATGSQGPAGAMGATGPQGAKGDTGDVGPTGATGPQGAKGDTGDQGPAGAAGATGSTGPAGPQGDPGPTGATGATGPAGADGADAPMPTRGTASIDFGAGDVAASIDVTGQAGILAASSRVRVHVSPADTADHSIDEHIIEPLRVFAHSIVDATGFTISAVCDVGSTHGVFRIDWEWV